MIFLVKMATKKRGKKPMDPLHKHNPRFVKKNRQTFQQLPTNTLPLPKKNSASLLKPFLWGWEILIYLKGENFYPPTGIEVVDVVVEPGGFPLIEFGSFHDSPVGGE